MSIFRAVDNLLWALYKEKRYNKYQEEKKKVQEEIDEAYRVYLEGGGEPILQGSGFLGRLTFSTQKEAVAEHSEGIGYRINPILVAELNQKRKIEQEAKAKREKLELEKRIKNRKEKEEQERKRKEEADRLFAAANYYCESPAEIKFLEAAISEFHLAARDGEFSGGGIALKNQVEIGRYRVDFLFNDSVIVEIDGHEYHSGRDAVNRDASRDAELRRKGYRILRIPAYRVFHNAAATISDVRDML